ncbi:insulin-like growth factor-binding protein 2-B [Genypterus blacodes]|uniref:insulin-like growth factor-binding protein 2-B n=1 Tax=Genypterus blacodes TaxID=154954 RepID=UPI003F762EC5
MLIFFTCGLLFAYVALPGILLGDLAFRCPSCDAESSDACPKVTTCEAMVREPGCGCCPVCARLEGELCGVYTPRCSSGLRCYPSTGVDLPLQQLIRGLGRCGQKVDLDDVVRDQDQQDTNEVHRTEEPTKKPIESWLWPKGNAMKQHQNERKTKMKTQQQEDTRTQRGSQSACQQELDKVLEEISKMTAEDNRGPLEDLYELKFPNCDRFGQYNVKQCNMSTHGQRGECWCVNPLTGVQIPTTPRVRGDPNCNQFQEELRAMPTAAAFR